MFSIDPKNSYKVFVKSIVFVFALLGLTMQVAFASTLLVMGDSLSAAYNLRQEQGWVSLLQDRLSETHPDITVVNASVSGETTQGGVARFEQLIDTHQPKWVIIELGANDALRGYPLSQTKQNLATMVTLSQQTGAKVLLLGNHIPPNYGKRYSELFFGLYQQIAEQYSTAYMPFMLEDVALDKDLFLSDGLHPNADAQVILLESILPYLSPLLNKE